MYELDPAVIARGEHDEGNSSFYDGVLRDACPHADPFHREWWLKGWDDAQTGNVTRVGFPWTA